MEENLKDKVVLLTGATSGIGLALAKKIATAGAELYIVGRRLEKTSAVVHRLKRDSGNEKVEYLLADLGNLDSVRNLAQVFKMKAKRLDVLLHVAGTVEITRKVSPPGVEGHFMVNYLSRFLLTHLLLDVLKAAPAARVIQVAGAYHKKGKIDFDDLEYRKNYSWQAANARSKLADVLFCYALARRLKPSGITVNCLHPGAVRTGVVLRTSGIPWYMKLAYHLMKGFFIPPEKAAEFIFKLGFSPDYKGVTGKYFASGKEQKSSPQSYDRELQEKLWKESLRLTGIEAFDNLPVMTDNFN